MSWSDIVGHVDVRVRLERGWQSGRLPSSWLFVGPEGVGKLTFALQFARTLLCEKNRAAVFDSCDQCPGCLQVMNGSHPDLLRVARPADKSSIPVALFIGDSKEKDNHGLCRSIAMKPVRGAGKVAIIDDADDLNNEGANSLLKTLEEPPPRTVLILVGTSVNRQLPTILSRCQVASFSSLTQEETVLVLKRQKDWVPVRPITELAELAGGSVVMARLLDDPAVFEFREKWLAHLSELDPAANEMAKTLVTFAEQGGESRKTSQKQRDQLHLMAEVAITFFDLLMLKGLGLPGEGDRQLQASVEAAFQKRAIDPEWNSRCIDRTTEFQNHLAANVAPLTACHAWLDDLSEFLKGHLVPPLAW